MVYFLISNYGKMCSHQNRLNWWTDSFLVHAEARILNIDIKYVMRYIWNIYTMLINILMTNYLVIYLLDILVKFMFILIHHMKCVL